MLTIYGKANCGYCDKAKNLANGLGIQYDYHDVIVSPDKMEELKSLIPNVRQVPQIFHGETHIGGYDQMKAAVDADVGVVATWNTQNA